MPFTVDDFDDLIRLLQERTDWRARLRDVLLPRELFEPPALVKELTALNLAEREGRERLQTDLTDFRRETNERFDAVDRRLEGVDRRFEQVDKRFDEVDRRFDRVDGRLDRVEGRLEHVEGNLERVEGRLSHVESDLTSFREETRGQLARVNSRICQVHRDIGTLKGNTLEQRFRELPTLFADVVPHPVALSRTEVDAWLHQLVADGRLTRAELVRVLRADLIFRGGTASRPAYLVVEVSWLVDTTDVERAAQRAALLRKAGVDARPAVAGQHMQPEALALAERIGVGRVIEGELDADEAADGASPG